MLFIKATVATALLAASVAAQFTINGTLVDASTAASWCAAEISTCGILCSGAVSPNNCSTTTAEFDCKCSKNDSQPGLSYYTGTMPTFICQQVYSNCIAAGANDAAAQKLCTEARAADCGTLDPSKFVASSASSSSSSSSATATASSTGSSSSATPTASTAAAAINQIGTEYKAGIFAVGLAAVFGFML